MANSRYRCLRCRAYVDCGERSDGERVRCRCGHRPTFRHVAAEGASCYPECFDSGHWRLGVAKKPKKKKKRKGGIGCPHPDGVWRWQAGLMDGSTVQHASKVVPEAPYWCSKHKRASSMPCPSCAAARRGKVA